MHYPKAIWRKRRDPGRLALAVTLSLVLYGVYLIAALLVVLPWLTLPSPRASLMLIVATTTALVL